MYHSRAIYKKGYYILFLSMVTGPDNLSQRRKKNAVGFLSEKVVCARRGDEKYTM